MNILHAATIDGRVRIPGSKSHTHRAHVLAAQSDRSCRIEHPLRADDPDATLHALEAFGAVPEVHAGRIDIHPFTPQRPAAPVDLANAGTGLRLITAYAARWDFETTFTGDDSLCRRPNAPLLDALRGLGARIADGADKLPYTVQGPIRGGDVAVSGSTSSQFTSALLLSLPMADRDSTVTLTPPVRSRPYLDITQRLAQRFGLRIETDGDTFHIPGGQCPRAEQYAVPADWSTAAFPMAAAAITGGRVEVVGPDPDDAQGDRAIVEHLRSFGITIQQGETLTVTGGPMASPGTIDVTDTPDLFPALAVVAACAAGTTTFVGGATLRHKECDRIAAMADGLHRMGIRVEQRPDGLVVHGGRLQGAAIHSHHDHRIHMAFAIAALAARGETRIDHPACVAISYPGFHDDLARLTGAP